MDNIASFSSEHDLVTCYSKMLSDVVSGLSKDIKISLEVIIPGSIPDMVLYVENDYCISYLITFEFKLRNWKRALSQAFRHRNFGNEAYVVLDNSHAAPAIKQIEDFRNANVGLITLDSDRNIYPWFSPTPNLPFSIEHSTIMAKTLISKSKFNSEGLLFAKKLTEGESISQLKPIKERYKILVQ